MIIPQKLKKGDTIGVIAPSDIIDKESLEVLNNSITLMEASGFKMEFGNHVFENETGYGATAKQKAEDINMMFANPNIKAIFCASGGFNSNASFEYIDYEMIKQNPKILCGFSDSTSITNMISEKSGIITFNGPTFKALTSWATEYGYKSAMKRFVEGSLSLAEEDDEFYTIKEGTKVVQGELVGGNLSLTSKLVAGKYKVNFENKILFLEELCLESPAAMVSNYLYYMKQNDVFSKIKGLWIGNYDGIVPLEKIVLDTIGDDYDFPIIKSNNFGHTEKKMVIPVGGKARIDVTKDKKIELIEECVK